MKWFVVLTIILTVNTGGCYSNFSVSCLGELDLAIRDASDYLNNNISKGSMIVIFNIQSGSETLSYYIIDELIYNLVDDKFFKAVDW